MTKRTVKPATAKKTTAVKPAKQNDAPKTKGKEQLNFDDMAEELVGKKEFTNPLIQKALEKHAQEEEERKVKQMMRYLQTVDSVTSDLVCELRKAREVEKHRKSRLSQYLKFVEEFKVSGDIDQFQKNCKGIDLYL